MSQQKRTKGLGISILGALVAPIFILLSPLMALPAIWRMARKGWR